LYCFSEKVVLANDAEDGAIWRSRTVRGGPRGGGRVEVIHSSAGCGVLDWVVGSESITLFPSHGGDNQRWEVTSNDVGSVAFRCLAGDSRDGGTSRWLAYSSAKEPGWLGVLPSAGPIWWQREWMDDEKSTLPRFRLRPAGCDADTLYVVRILWYTETDSDLEVLVCGHPLSCVSTRCEGSVCGQVLLWLWVMLRRHEANAHTWVSLK
jgi:hypothetical protein